MTKHAKLSPGIYRDQYGIRAVVAVSTGRAEKRYPPGTPLQEIKRWRAETAGKFAALARKQTPRPARGTLAADIERYARTLTIASAASRRSDLLAWVELYGDLPRWRLSKGHVIKAIQAWQAPEARTIASTGEKQPYAAWTIRHRLEALRTLYRALDGPDVTTPVDDVPFAKPTDGAPTFVNATTIEAVGNALAPYPQTQARYWVLATCGCRPVELMRAKAGDVDLKQQIWTVRTAKGGVARAIRLNTPEMRAAWRRFIEADAWGSYDTTLHARRLHKAGWPKGVRPYALRGTWGMEMSRRGVDLADIQHLMGHRDLETTRLYYVPAEGSRLAAATKATAGRFRVRK